MGKVQEIKPKVKKPTAERTEVSSPEWDLMYKGWLDACLQFELPAISADTAARTMAVLLEYGNNEGFTYSPRFLAEMNYIQTRFGLKGGEIPDADFFRHFQKYVAELKDHQASIKQKTGGEAASSIAPEWVPRLLKERYSIKFMA